MKKTLRYALLLAGMTTLPAMAHVGYTGRNFGTFNDASAASTISGQGVTGNYGWIDGTDADYGDAHKTLAYRFTLLNPTDVTLTFQQATSQVTDHSGNVSTSKLGLAPGFSLYQGLAHVSPIGADYDSSAISKANRPADTEGAFRGLNDWKIGNDADAINGVPASLSFFKHVGHAYDGAETRSVSGFDGVADGKVSHTFSNLAAGDYSVFVGGSDYLGQEISNPNILTTYGVTGTLVAGVVPEPETYAMLLAGLGLMGAIVRRRESRRRSAA
jgi:hypothetical protein